MLAVTAFGALPALISWGIGACLGVSWLGALKLAKRPAAHVHFAPFLFLGLIAAIVWLNRAAF